MNRYAPLTIFIVSFIGSMILATVTAPTNYIIEANPLIRLLFSRSTIMPWIYTVSVIAFILLVSHFGFKKKEYTRTYHIVYWLLAVIFLVNFVRELILVF